MIRILHGLAGKGIGRVGCDDLRTVVAAVVDGAELVVELEVRGEI